MRIILIFLFCCCSYGLMAQTGGVRGNIVTSDGAPAEFINIIIKGTSKGAVTNDRGFFEIKNLPAGESILVVSFVGLEKKEISVEIQEGTTIVVSDIVLVENKQKLDEVIISGSKGYKIDQLSNSLRLQTPILETPQNIQVITGKIIGDQQSIDMLESVSRNVSGVQMIEHWGNFARVNMRGFKIPAFRNGMNVDLPWGPLAEDMSIVERIEFVKGPAGFMASSGEPGGLYNVVTKKPVLDQQNELSITAGSFNTLRSTLDIGGKVNKEGTLLYRVNLMGLTKESHRNYEFNNRYTIAPSLSYTLSDRTKLTAEYIYQYSQMSALGSSYVFSPKGFGELPRDFTLLEPNIDPTNIDEHNVFINLKHDINEDWKVTAQLGYLRYEQIGSSLWPENLDTAGNLIRGISIGDALNVSKMGQIFVNGDVRTGSVRHLVLAGIDIAQKDFYADWFQTGSYIGADTFNIYNPEYGVPSSSFPVFDRSQSIRKRAVGSYPAITGQRYSSLFIQDELGFFENKLRLTLAGRYTDYIGWSYGDDSDDQVFSPRAGISFSVAKNTTVYGLYDQSFIPQLGSDVEGKGFVPVRANNLEAGVKRDWADGKWNSTLAVYHMTKENVLVGHPDRDKYPFAQIQLGEVQSKGIELDVQGEIVEGLRLVINYANTNVEITEDTDETIIGDRVAGHARHMTNGWLHYEFPKPLLRGFGVSLGYQYQIDRSSWNWGADNEANIPDYFRLDGAITWKSRNLNVGLNVNNLLNEYLYSGAAYGDDYYWQTEPGTNYRLNLALKF